MKKFQAIKKASIYGVIGNLFLAIIKSIIGFVTGSHAMIADFFNSASDVFSSVMTFIGNKIASKPSDDDHNLGHGKAEYIYSMLISIAMFFFSFQVLKDSILSLVTRKAYTFSIWLIVVCLITIITKVILFIYTSILSKKYRNLLLEANSKDHRNDIFITLLNLLSSFLALKNIYFVDGVVGILISLWIFFTAVKIFRESYDVLMDKAIGNELRQKVLEIIQRHKEVIKINHFNSTPIGYQYQISVTIFVDGNLSTFASHKIANQLEKEIIKDIPEIYLAVIHVNPMKVTNNKKA